MTAPATPLPWPEDLWIEQWDGDSVYARHAANVLPRLVEALEAVWVFVSDDELDNADDDPYQQAIAKCKAALAAARGEKA